MKGRGRLGLLLPLLSVFLLATIIQAAETTEVEHKTTPTTATISTKSEPTVSITPGRLSSSNRPEVTTDSGLDAIQDDDKIRLDAKQERMQKILAKDDQTLMQELPKFVNPILSPSQILRQEIEKLDQDGSTDQKIQDEVAKVIKAQAQRPRLEPRLPTTKTVLLPSASKSTNPTEGRAMKDLLQAETDVQYTDDLDEDDDDDDDDDEDEDNYDDEDDDDEQVMTQCPDYCRCSGQYAAATTARCSKLIDNQSFSTSIAHLMIENAGEIRLGPHALRSRGLDRLETITIVNTRISEIDRTAFDGVRYLFSVNLTQNGAIDIPHDTFQNNTQLSLLTISGHPIAPNWLQKSSYVFDSPSVTEFDFSGNLFKFLPSNAFSKMLNLAYLNLSGNKLSNVTRDMFAPLEALVELDLSKNWLNSLPLDIFKEKELQNLRITDNSLITLQTIQALELNSLDVSHNQIKVIAKDDLIKLPALEQLVVSFNGLKRIHQHAFSLLISLDHLDISNNKLNLFTEHHLRNNPRLQILLMSDNPDLGSLPVFKVHGLEHNTYSIFRFECANCGLTVIENGTFNAMPALTKLNLARNRISSLPEGMFEPLTSLRVLDLSDNLISNIPRNMLHGAGSLSKLNLAGNPLTTLQVTPFLMAPELTRLDVSRCQLRRVWSEARQPLKSLRFLSVRGNELERITTEELKATPKLSGLDASRNPLSCDTEFNDAIQYLVSHGITPMETLRSISNLGDSDSFIEAADGITQWSELAKLVCEGEYGGIPPRRVPSKPPTTPSEPDDEDAAEISKDDIENNLYNPRINSIDHGPRINDDAEEAWWELDKTMEYEDLYSVKQRVYHWYNHRALWPVMTVILVVLSALIIIIQFARYLARRKGRGPVLRPPLMLRQGLVDNKNCGLVYKPLQEEIATPQMPKRGSCYSSSTFHYDKIVPESV